ncbi:TonB-dependent receptor [Dyella sp.]|jgi:outer membrane receptor for ferrienterochelin and colicin|uniref:TonB-dependent receptor n=1 Tax=Dyella sp. TaxID=1869338 RepID=UPI002D79A39B|nr:TonB-dependent receptor [Dyella sp.]HET6434006.1 TonB-dependent receptor [Dyella sp.]
MKAPLQLKRKLLASVIATSIVAIGAAPSTAWSQSAYATLRGNAPPNAQVTAFNPATGTTRRTTASADGSYTLTGLQPGTYQVDAGPGTQKAVTLTVASTSTLNLEAAAAGAAAPASAANATTMGAVTVSATTLQEVRTPEVGGTVSQHQIDTIPQISRNFLEFADTVPGMIFEVSSNGNTTLRGGAQNKSSTNVYIDGVGQKSYVKEGGISGQIGSQGNPFPQLAIGEYKVITSNYKAEYDQISSAAVTAQTKSGTNEFHGEVFGRYTNDAFRERTPAEEAADRKTESEEKEYGFAIGGPIIKDKMHFFGTYEAKRFNTPITVVPDANAIPGVPYLPADAAAQLGPSNLPFEENLYFGKIDWEPTDRDRFELSAQIRKENQTGGIGGPTSASAAYKTKNDDKRYVLRWQHSGEAYFNELLLTHEDAFNAPVANNLGNGVVYTYPLPDSDPTIVATGAANPLSTQNKGQKGPSIQDDLTFNDLEWNGDHVVKTGFKYKDITLTAADAADINPQFYYDVTAGGVSAIPYKAFFTKPVTGLGLSPTVETKAKQFGIYVQDDWAVNDKLTLNLGVRWDYEKNPAYTDFVTPQNVIDALNSPNPDPNAPAGQTYAQALALGGINVNDYISNGHNRKNFKGEWQPRLGFSYDLNNDEAHVIHGGVGRAYDRNLFDYLQLETTKAALPQYTVYFRDPATGNCHRGSNPDACYDWDPSYLNGLPNLQALLASSNAGTEVDVLNNHLKAPHSDQFSIGMSNRIGEWQTDATLARVLSYDGFGFTLGNRYPNGDFFQGGSQPWGNGVPGFGALIVGNNGIETRTTQLLLSANKPYDQESGWGATFSYTYTSATQNRDIGEHYSFDEATLGNYPFIDSNAAPRHRLVATGVVDGPWDITMSVKLTLATPTPGNTTACYGPYVFATGSTCTPIAGTPEGSGRFLVGPKIFGYRDVDFQATKNFELGHGVTLYGRFDVLNVFNFRNYNDLIYQIPAGASPYVLQTRYNPTGNITFVPRTFKFEVGMKF